MFTLRKSAALVLTSLVAATTLMSASASSTSKALSSNFTLVNLVSGTNQIHINYIKSDGSQWRTPEDFPLSGLGAQAIRRQYQDDKLTAGSGSVVVSSDGPVGAVVQILTTSGVPTFGAYDGVSQGASSASVPLVQRKRGTASGISNSQIIIQNASNADTDISVDIFDGTSGAKIFTKSMGTVHPNVSVTYDLADEQAGNVPDNFFGSAIVHASGAGQVAVVSNLFNGADTMQTFNAFTESKTKWGVPLFAVRLANFFSTPVSVQNAGATPIPVNGVTLSCVKDAAAPGDATLTFHNTTAIGPSQSYFFNPVTDNSMPALWFGACTVDAGAFQTAVFIQLRFVVPGQPLAKVRADSHDGIPLDSTDKIVVVPLWAKRLSNGFSSAVTILNLSNSADAHVTLDYKAGDGAAANCTANFTRTIQKGGSLIQNHRLATGTGNDNPNSVPQLPANCFGTLTVTSSDQPIHAFVQLDQLDEIRNPPAGQEGDPFQTHNAFTIASTSN